MYRWDAKEYSASSSAQTQWAHELIEKLSLKGHERVLDIGCGDGKVTASIAGRLPSGSVLGIDNSEDMLNFAREAFPPDQHPNCSFRCLDARDLDFPAEFDAVFSNAALHWIIGHEEILRGIRAALKPCGRVLLQMGGKGNARDVIGIIEGMGTVPPWHDYFRDFPFPYGFYGEEEYRPWLAAAGLNAVRVELIAKDMAQEGKEALAGWIRTTWLPYTQRLPLERREEFIRELVDRYAELHPPDGKGLLHVAMVRLEVEAEKK